jgi:hypothetical protein
MKYAPNRAYADPEKAARKLIEIANSVEAVQDGRIFIELVNTPHRPKISSILIRNTVAPIATPTTLGSCLAIEASNHRKPGVVMSTIPLDVQRRCERRWAARLSRPTESVAPRNQRPARESQQIAGPADNSEPQQLSGSPRTLGG